MPHDDSRAAEPVTTFRRLLHAQRVWDTELPAFDVDTAPATPLTLFHRWFAQAVAAGQVEPHVMQLATVDADEKGPWPDVRTLMLHDADERGWHFATHATSRKGRQLAANPAAALHFYWPTQGRQIRVRGQVTTAAPAEAQADLHARSTGALAAALVGHQSEALGSQDELARASEAAWERAAAEPSARVPSWTLYVLAPDEVEFFQGDARRQHVRLRYERRHEGGSGSGGEDGTTVWRTRLLWP
ncbi:pyridoxine/pyridoxamine 5'-phosphate oxidase [Streptomyces apocyni]|uniref:pyridoxine/pyridoxamine 5'-phosphate oxidase n=1 Tax=Streptomyces apocyni TaxID=2654677 RepID=UPI0012EA6A0F|nr:pyridoxal 5'-phosphate synthase [Streptomyces apocyni]